MHARCPNTIYLRRALLLHCLGGDFGIGFYVEVFVGGEGVDCVGGKVDAGFRKLLALNGKIWGKFGVGELKVRREREGKKG